MKKREEDSDDESDLFREIDEEISIIKDEIYFSKVAEILKLFKKTISN